MATARGRRRWCVGEGASTRMRVRSEDEAEAGRGGERIRIRVCGQEGMGLGTAWRRRWMGERVQGPERARRRCEVDEGGGRVGEGTTSPSSSSDRRASARARVRT